MALVSPGVEVSLINESFYIPAQASTVPLIIMATAEHKKQMNGTSPALGTYEHNVIRQVTSVTQSIQLYGVPRFLQTTSGEDRHGDTRNEYGLLALNQYLGMGNRAYVVRANVNLDDERQSILSMWLAKMASTGLAVEIGATDYINQFNTSNNYLPVNPLFKRTLTKAEFLSIAKSSMIDTYKSYNFKSSIFKTDFEGDHRTVPLDVYNNSFTNITGSFIGLEGAAEEWVTSSSGSTPGKETEFTPEEAGDLLIDLADDFAFTLEFLTSTSLGANDAARRVAVVTALQESLAHPQLRSEQYEYNIVMCPGFYETADDIAALIADIGGEAIGIVDVPLNLDPEGVANWAGDPLSGRQFNDNLAYYAGHPLMSNLDGRLVLGTASGVALRTYAYSDKNTAVWFAPAGAQRGVVSGVQQVGYFSGTAGQATKFVESVMNVGQRDALYRDTVNINPITFLPGRGIIVMGQKTSSNTTSALDRVNVVRLIAYIRRALRKSMFAFIFEPNDQHTRDNAKAMADNFLKDIMFRRGLYDFVVVCDPSNNGPDRIDRSEMVVDIGLKPVKAVEFIYVPIRVVNTGAEL